MKLWKEFLKDESGQDLIEMALIVALISIAAMTTLGLVGGKVDGVLGQVNAKLP